MQVQVKELVHVPVLVLMQVQVKILVLFEVLVQVLVQLQVLVIDDGSGGDDEEASDKVMSDDNDDGGIGDNDGVGDELPEEPDGTALGHDPRPPLLPRSTCRKIIPGLRPASLSTQRSRWRSPKCVIISVRL